jgi:hypothetical protein
MKGGFMKNSNEIPKYVTQARAAYLLGLLLEEICRISQEARIGHMEKTWLFMPRIQLVYSNERAGPGALNGLYPNHADLNPLAQTLGVILTGLLCLFLRFEWLG